MLLPAVLTRCGFASFNQQILDQLRGLHLVEGFDTQAEELHGQILGYLLCDAGVLVDDAKDESLLAVRALPLITDRFGLLVAVLTTIAVDLVGAAVVVVTVSIAVGVLTIGLRDVTGILNFLINGLLQELVELLDLCLCLGDV